MAEGDALPNGGSAHGVDIEMKEEGEVRTLDSLCRILSTNTDTSNLIDKCQYEFDTSCRPYRPATTAGARSHGPRPSRTAARASARCTYTTTIHKTKFSGACKTDTASRSWRAYEAVPQPAPYAALA